jgi:hypothetical protein
VSTDIGTQLRELACQAQGTHQLVEITKILVCNDTPTVATLSFRNSPWMAVGPRGNFQWWVPVGEGMMICRRCGWRNVSVDNPGTVVQYEYSDSNNRYMRDSRDNKEYHLYVQPHKR